MDDGCEADCLCGEEEKAIAISHTPVWVYDGKEEGKRVVMTSERL